jgi:hypothetical protein
MTQKMHWQVLHCLVEIGGKGGACYRAVLTKLSVFIVFLPPPTTIALIVVETST